MRTLCRALVLVLATATICRAQDAAPVEERAQPSSSVELKESSRTVLDKKFWMLYGGLNTAMLLDTKSTFDVAKVCQYCREGNPFVAPFVRRGPTVTYVAGVIFDAGVMTISARMRGSDDTWMRRSWWVMPVSLIVGHSIAYRHNVNLSK